MKLVMATGGAKQHIRNISGPGKGGIQTTKNQERKGGGNHEVKH